MNCADCPHFKTENPSSSGSDDWDSMIDWICDHPELPKQKIIQPKVEWFEEYHITIPKWCPLRKKK